MQDLSETRVSKVNAIWSLAAKLETSSLSRSIDHLNHLSSEIPRNNPLLDSMMFVRHNVSNWQEPGDMVFEPSPVWHDDDLMCVDETSKTFLRNVLGRSKSQLQEYKQDVEKQRREVEAVKRVRQNVQQGKDKRDEAEIVRAMFTIQELVHSVERKRLTAEVEVSTITSTVGDLSLGAQNHRFKSETFKIPTNCDLCGDRIWGLSAKGFSCSDCGYTCHSKCELKVPASCPGELSKEDKKKVKTERQAAANAQSNVAETSANGGAPPLARHDTMNSLSSGYAASAKRSVSANTARNSTTSLVDEPTADTPAAAPPAANKSGTIKKNRVVAPPPSSYVSGGPSNGLNGASEPARSSEPRGKMLYPYQANGAGEISVDEGKEVVIMEPDGTLSFKTLTAPEHSTC